MSEYQLYFACYKLSVSGDPTVFTLPDRLKEFLTEQTNVFGEFALNVLKISELPKMCRELRRGEAVCHTGRFDLYKGSDSWVFFENDHEDNRDNVLVCSPDYRKMTLYMANDYIPVSSLIRIACESGLTRMSGIPLHASLIEKDGQGIVFLGPSGMGKSTQARLWKQYMNADFVSGDRPTLVFKDGKWYGCGMPWDGKDGLYRQKMVPVHALIALEQSPENRIVRLNSVEAMKVLLKQVMMPMWDNEAMDSTGELMWQLAGSVPFFHLKNRADEACVRLVNDTVL